MPGNLYDDEDFQKQKEFRQKYYPQVKGVSKDPIPGATLFYAVQKGHTVPS